jgi:hypothetical protein
LEFGQEVRGFGKVEGAAGDEEDVVGFDRAVLGGDGGAFDEGEEVALDAFAGDVAAAGGGFAAAGDLVDFVEEDDAVGFGVGDGVLGEAVGVQEFVGFFAVQGFAGGGDGEFAGGGAVAEHALHHFAEVDGLAGGHAGHVELGDGAGGGVGEVEFDFAVFEVAVAEHLAEFGAGVGAGLFAGECGDEAVFGGEFGFGLDVAAAGFAEHGDGGFDEVADDGFDVAADIADFGELGCFDLEEGGASRVWRGGGRSRSCRTPVGPIIRMFLG